MDRSKQMGCASDDNNCIVFRSTSTLDLCVLPGPFNVILFWKSRNQTSLLRIGTIHYTIQKAELHWRVQVSHGLAFLIPPNTYDLNPQPTPS